MIAHGRDFLRALAAAPLAAIAARARCGAHAPSRLLVMVFLYGGNDGYNTWVPYADPLYYRVRPNIAVPRDSVLKITRRHGFHPSLAALMPAWEARGPGASCRASGYPQWARSSITATSRSAFTGVRRAASSPPRAGSRARAAHRSATRSPMRDRLRRARHPRGRSDGPVPRREAGRGAGLPRRRPPATKRRLAACVLRCRRRAGACLALDGRRSRAVTLRTRTSPRIPSARRCAPTVELAALDRSLPVIHVALNGLDDDKHHSVDSPLGTS